MFLFAIIANIFLAILSAIQYSLPMGAQMLPYKSCHKCCSFKVFVTNISLLKYYHKHFPFEVLSQMLYQRLVGLLQMLQQRLVGLSQTSQQRLFTIVAAKAFHNCCSKRLFTNAAAKGFSQILQSSRDTSPNVLWFAVGDIPSIICSIQHPHSSQYYPRKISHC